MAQHFLTSAKARTLDLRTVFGLSNEESEMLFAAIRWEATDGKPVCSHCGCPICYPSRRRSGALRYRCKACRKDFSLTSGTLFAFHKLPLKVYLAAIVLFVNEVKGKCALALSRDLGVQYKTAWVLAHKLREAVCRETFPDGIGGDGKVVEIDGAYFGGYVKKANHKEDRVDGRKARMATGKVQSVVVVRERGGDLFATAFKNESVGARYMVDFIKPGTVVMADDASDWNSLHAHFDVKRVNHKECYSSDEACTNLAESFFSRLRRGEIGIHHHIAGPYLGRYAGESSWRERHRRQDNGQQTSGLISIALMATPSRHFCGYWQRIPHRGEPPERRR
jgi:transposase-like protein